MSLAMAVRDAAGVQLLEAPYEARALPAFDSSEHLGFQQPRLYANFVRRVVGIAAIPHELQSRHLIAAAKRSWPLTVRRAVSHIGSPAMTRIP